MHRMVKEMRYTEFGRAAALIMSVKVLMCTLIEVAWDSALNVNHKYF